jgi:hypothetical protein
LKKIFIVLALLAASLSFPTGVQAQKSTSSKTVSSAFSTRLTTMVAGGPATGITFTWNYVANAPACGGTANCQSGFTIVDTTAGTTIATPAVLGPTALSFTYTPSGGLYFGTHTFSIVANGFNSAGSAITSVATTTSVTNGITSLNGPTNLIGTIQ